MDVDNWIQLLKEKKILNEKQLRSLITIAKQILIEESNVQPVKTPVNICGDIHGQFFDLLELFSAGGEISNGFNYIFIGDFVDRGYNSVETIEYLLCLKVRYPERITLLRGNHESRQVSQVYGFYDEICKKYGNLQPWKQICDLFDCLPTAALVDEKILCIHGGLSPQIKTVDQIRMIDRRQELPAEGPYADLMWSDPDDVELWAHNSRGAGWLFGKRVTHDFNHINGLELIVRAHQLVQEGYIYWFDQQLVTLWSAPNYCYRCGNAASILQINQNLERNYQQFSEVPESSQQIAPKKCLPYFL